MTLVHPEYCIRKIESLHTEEKGTTVFFSDGSSGFFPRSHEWYEPLVRSLRLSKAANGPTGFILGDDNEILDVAGAERDTVAFVVPPQVDTGMDVWFGHMDGVSLSSPNTRYAQILADLEEARLQNRPLWYIHKGGILLDTLVLPADADGALCRLFEIPPR